MGGFSVGSTRREYHRKRRGATNIEGRWSSDRGKKLSSNCGAGRHNNCFTTSCECSCGHGVE